MLLVEPLQEGRAEVWRTRPFRAIALVWKRVPWRVEAGALAAGSSVPGAGGLLWQPQQRGPHRGVGGGAGALSQEETEQVVWLLGAIVSSTR